MSRAGAQSNGRAQRAAGFTLVEMLVVVVIIGLIGAFVAPNLGAFVPKTRLDSAAKILAGRIDNLRSEARIQGKRYVLELDLKRGRWRDVAPPEMQLTTDQESWTLEAQTGDWREIGEDVGFVGAGNANEGIVRDGFYKIVFDENGFTADQVVMLHLISDKTMVWSVQIRGLTGQTEIVTEYDGKEHPLDEVTEGSF